MKNLFKKVTGLFCSFGLLIGMIGNVMPIMTEATTVYGDVNNDGYVNIADVAQLSIFLYGSLQSSAVNLKYADVDKNTVIDVNDLKVIQNYLSGTISSLPYSESGTTFDYDSYTFPSYTSRDYVKYDCSTGNETNYTLSPPSSLTSIGDQLRAGSIDDRILDSSANAQCIVYLSFQDSSGDYYRGSGFIVSDHVIATCAHCLYDSSGFFTNYKVKVYNVAGTSVVATYNASELHIPQNYYNSPSAVGNYDYGLIYVEENLSAYGTMALGATTDNFKYTAQTVSVSGFPATVNGSNTTYRYYGTGTISNNYFSTGFRLGYTSYTSGGDSGGPVYIEYTLGNETFRSAIGIHTGSAGSMHIGTRISQPLLRFYYSNSNLG